MAVAAVEAARDGGQAQRALGGERVEVGDAVGRRPPDPAEGLALARRHVREVRLDVRQPGVALGEAPASGRQPGGHFEHLVDAAGGDGLLEQRVDDPVAPEQHAVEGGTAEHPTEREHRSRQRVQHAPLEAGELGVRQPAA